MRFNPLIELWAAPAVFFARAGIFGLPFYMLYVGISVLVASAVILGTIWGGVNMLLYLLFG